MREVFSLNRDWKFCLDRDITKISVEDYFNMFDDHTKTGVISVIKSDGYYDDNWQTVDLPHDWCIAEPVDENAHHSQGYRAQGKAWYRKRFQIDERYAGKRIFIKFEGIVGKSEIYFNNIKIAHSESGFTPITVEVTDIAYFDRDNNLCVECDNSVKEGWWYEGGGIYRNTYLIVKEQCSFADDGVFVSPQRMEDGWTVRIRAELENPEQDTKVVFSTAGKESVCKAADLVQCELPVSDPELWDCEHPNLYSMEAIIRNGDRIVDKVTIKYGFRHVKIDPQKGLFLNGKHTKLQGVCLHNDHCGVGVATAYDELEYRIQKLKEMGCNAIRTSHNPETPAFYDVCDRMGMLVMNEVRHFSSTVFGLHELRSFVRRDRNHPCVVLWSLFNEEPLQCTVSGEKIAYSMRKCILEQDDTRPITGGMNGPIEQNGVVNVVDVMGFNYLQYGYDEFHEIYPNIPVIGSETGSYLTTRGEHIPPEVFAHPEKVENENLLFWSATPGETWKYIFDRDYVLGGFEWTGIDYRGENSWPGVAGKFGIMDTCCFPKDNFYWHQSLWCNEPILHLSRNCDGDVVVCYSNCDLVQLYDGEVCIAEFANDPVRPPMVTVPCKNREILAVGSLNGTVVCKKHFPVPGAFHKLVLEYDATAVSQVDKHILVNVKAVDCKGVVLPDYQEEVSFLVESGGKLFGIGNGDNTDHTVETSNTIRLFHGCCQLILAPDLYKTELTLTAKVSDAQFWQVSIPYAFRPHIAEIPSTSTRIYISNWRMSDVYNTYPSSENIHNNGFTWIPTTINSKSLMMSGKTGFATVAGVFVIAEENPNDTVVVNVERIKGNVDVYIDGELIYASEGYEQTGISCRYRLKQKGRASSLAFVFKLGGEECGIYSHVYIV